MSGIKMTTPETRRFEPLGGPPGSIGIARDVDGKVSGTIGAGLVTFEHASMEWTVLYDEYLYGVEGTLTLKTREGDFELGPGCGIWLPKGTWLIYEAKEKATVVFTIYPVNWREAQATA